MRSLAEAPLLERRCDAARLGLPVDGAAIRAWLDPMSEWGGRLAGATARARPTNSFYRGRAPMELG